VQAALDEKPIFVPGECYLHMWLRQPGALWRDMYISQAPVRMVAIHDANRAVVKYVIECETGVILGHVLDMLEIDRLEGVRNVVLPMASTELLSRRIRRGSSPRRDGSTWVGIYLSRQYLCNPSRWP